LIAWFWPQLDLFAPPPAPAAPARQPAPATAEELAGDEGRWRWTRPWLVSPHRARARRELNLVRAHFPELEGITVTIGMTKRRTILGLASMGGDPALWLRPRIIHRFVIAHEFVHLLQARDLVPGGEKAADLYALARSLEVIDVAPSYLAIPRPMQAPPTTGRTPRLAPGVPELLHDEARRAIAANRGKTARGAVRRFELALAEPGTRAGAASAAR
jgi:hypothetical protein